MRRGGRTLRTAVGGAPPAAEFAILTAYNPASLPAPVGVNRAALRRLRERVERAGLSWVPARAHGTGPDPRRWDEPGLAVTGAGSVPAAVALAASVGQNAVLAAEAGRPPRLLATRPGFCGRQLGEPIEP